MKLLIKQRVFSWSDTYDVYDESGDAKYYVKAELFSLGHRIHVYECQTGVEIGVIHEKLLTFLPKFEIERNGVLLGTIKKQFTLFRPAYEIDCNGWYVQGDFFGWNYEVLKGNARILQITKEVLHWGDTYVLDIPNEEEEQMGLLLAIAIDAANCSNS